MLALGIDIGTSGVRTAVLDERGEVIAPMARAPHRANAAENADAWWLAVQDALENQINGMRAAGIDPLSIGGLAVDGTSGSMVLTDGELKPVTPALLYNTSGFSTEAQQIANVAPKTSITSGQSSSLARMLHLQAMDATNQAKHLLHQADFIAAKIAGRSVGSDDNNALKTGWDPQTRRWPAWFADAGVRTDLLPSVSSVGARVGQIGADVAEQFGLSPTTAIHAGTTDSIAAFLASGANRVGDGVTSLGTTLAIKLLSDVRVDDPDSGVYSHRLGDAWLAGGASNTGGGVLAHFFTAEQLTTLSEKIDPSGASPLDYYPLIKPGERFPANDPSLEPRLTPRPEDDVMFLHGMLESMARIEADGYKRLAQLGAPKPSRVFTAGGGAKNGTWSAIRRRHLDADFANPRNTEAAVGAARLCISDLS